MHNPNEFGIPIVDLDLIIFNHTEDVDQPFTVLQPIVHEDMGHLFDLIGFSWVP